MKHIWAWRRGICRVLWGNLRERDHLKYPGVDGRIILRRIFRKCCWVAWTGLIWLRLRTGGENFKYSNEALGSIKWGEYHDWLRTR